MTEFINAMNTVFSTLGAAIIIPIVLFVIALFLGCKPKQAFNSALLCGVGLQGFTLVINSYGGIMGPVIQQMVDNAGVSLSTLDTGWQSTSVIAYSTKVGILFIAVAIVIQIVLFLVKWTNVFMASDLWNNYSFMVWGSLLFALRGSMAMAMLLMVTQLLYILLFSELAAKRWSTYYQYPNCCMTAPHHLESLPFALVMNYLLSLIGFDKIKLNAQALQKKLGIIGEPMFIGLIVGGIIGIIGNFRALGTLAAWGTITSAMISTAAIMAVFPRVAGIFASAFTALTEASKKSAASGGEGREWYLSVNDACGYGEPNTLITGIILMPIMLGLAFILPGNGILPMADLAALPYMVEVFICVSNGNIAKSIVMGAIWFGIGLVVFTQFAPTFTEVALEAGFQLETQGVYICSFGIMCHPFIFLLFYCFYTQNIILIAVVIVLYFVLYFLLGRKYKEQIVNWMEDSATSYSNS